MRGHGETQLTILAGPTCVSIVHISNRQHASQSMTDQETSSSKVDVLVIT